MVLWLKDGTRSPSTNGFFRRAPREITGRIILKRGIMIDYYKRPRRALPELFEVNLLVDHFPICMLFRR
jgi:hypothetical protein